MRKRWARQVFAGVFLALFAFPLGAQEIKRDFYQGEEVVAQQVLVKFRPEAQSNMAQAMAAVLVAQDIEKAEGVGGTGILLLESRSKDVATLMDELAANPDVEYAEPNYILQTTDVPDDPRFPELWGLRNTGTPGADISAVPAWDYTVGSQGIVVGVIDTGIDYNHADLVANVWSAPTDFSVTIGGQTIDCPASSHGYRPVQRTCDPTETTNTHGTHVSGTIGATGNNGLGVVGVNWTASILGCKMFDPGGTTANAVNCIEFAIQTKQFFSETGEANVRMLSNSWGGGGYSQSLLDAIYRAYDNDILFVAAAGNNNRNIDTVPFYPASYDAPNMVAVASTTRTDARSSFSNYGANTVHLGAPGSSILSTTRNGGYGLMSGTSMATPHVSGAAALVLSVCGLDTDNLKAVLLASVDVIPSMEGRTITGGRLNVYSAILACTAAVED